MSHWSDAHCHLQDHFLGDDETSATLSDTLARAYDGGVDRVVVIGTDATTSAQALAITDHVQFWCCDVHTVDWSTFDAIYMFNPFAEASLGPAIAAGTRRERFTREVESALRKLAGTRRGTRLVTFHGLGGAIPEGFDLLYRELVNEGGLSLWVRT